MDNIKRHHSLKERVENFKHLYRRENDRPLFGFTTGSEYPLFRYNGAKRLAESPTIKPDDLIVGDYMEDCSRLFDELEMYGGDFIWTGNVWGY